ncbi:NAD(P)H-dependent oxidoreductase [Streptomyces griseoincarnatus]|uniref:NAD(P)H-dependent oxidoreductase n=1 Tax=Streptomyces sp. SMS_SU21 TaxID=2069440 RepID=UPI000C87E8E8|nr:NADPH-dependent FMN reductase [Streptomyces sp. SMS_SU21]MCA2202106.1 NAD(P)H-dependent oxidoreductase [Streptomyces sp. SMS_SU21]NEA93815.1 NAD(P)H-dependent oxidoreductase [Actinospica acidiphila]
MSVRILALVGSLRAGSHNRQLAEAAVKLAPEGVDIALYEGLAEIPFYNEDIDVEDGVPAAAAQLREAAAVADALLLFTPEYNGTIPAVLKNAIDWLSRPFGAGAIGGKPVVVVGTAFGQYGGVWAQDETRKAVGIAGGKVVEDLKLAIPGSVTRFAETHPADDTEVAEQLAEVLNRLHALVDGEKAAA